MSYSQQSLALNSKETLKFEKPLFYRNEKVSCGNIAQLALESGDWTFTATPYKDKIYKFSRFRYFFSCSIKRNQW